MEPSVRLKSRQDRKNKGPLPDRDNVWGRCRPVNKGSLRAPNTPLSVPTPDTHLGLEKSPQAKDLEGQAEPVGLEPTSPLGRRFSRPVQYQLCDGSKVLIT